MDKARFPGFYKLSIGERLNKVHENGWLTKEDLMSLRDGHHVFIIILFYSKFCFN